MDQISESPKWWRYLARFLLVVTIGVVAFSLFSLWATKYYVELGSIIMAFYFAYSLGISIGLVLLSVLGIIVGFFFRYSIRVYEMMFVLSMLPIATLAVLDY